MRRVVYCAMVISFLRRVFRKTLSPSGCDRVKVRPGDRTCECAMFLYKVSTINYRIGCKFIVGGRTSVDVNDRLCEKYGRDARSFGYNIGFYSTRPNDVTREYPDEFTSKTMMDFLNQAYDYVTKILPEGTRVVWT